MRKHIALLGLGLLLAGCGRLAAGPATAPPPPAKAGDTYPGPPVTQVAGAAFSRDGRLLLTAYRIEHPGPKDDIPKRLALWEVATGKKLWAAHPATASREDPPADTLVPVGFLPGDKLVLLRDKTSLQLWDVAKGNRVRTLTEDRDWALSCAALSADGKYVLTGGGSIRYPPLPPADEPRPLQLWEIASAKRTRTFGQPHLNVCEVALSSDGRLALSASSPSPEEPATLMLWEAATGKRLPVPPLIERIGRPVAFSPDGKRAVCGLYDSKSGKSGLVLWEVPSGNVVRQFDTEGSALAFTPDGQRLLIGGSGMAKGSLKLLELASGRVLSSGQFDSKFAPVFAFSPDGRLAFAGTGAQIWGFAPIKEPMKLSLWDLPEGKRTRALDDSPWTALE